MNNDFRYIKEVSHLGSGKDYCCYCGTHITLSKHRTVEHLVPLSKGGTNRNYNKRPCCYGCNRDRGNKSYDDWLERLEKEEKDLRKKLPHSYNAHKFRLIRIENIKYWKFYVETAGEKLYRKTYV